MTDTPTTSNSPLTLEQLTAKIDELPTLPTIVYELNKIISDPLSSSSDVEKIMANDAALTSKVLKLVNSAYYAIPGGVSNLARAIAYLGFDTVQQLVLATTIIDTLDNDQASNKFDIKGFWQHSMGTAMAAETIAKFNQQPSPADLFTCGLLHDIGKMALFTFAQEQLNTASQFAIENDLNIYAAENEIKHPSHTTLGMLLVKKWKLTNKIQLSAQYHHEFNVDSRQGVSSELNVVIDIVILANLLVHALKFGSSGHNKVLGAPKKLLDRLYLTPEKVKEVVRQIKNKLKNADAFLQIISE